MMSDAASLHERVARGNKVGLMDSHTICPKSPCRTSNESSVTRSMSAEMASLSQELVFLINFLFSASVDGKIKVWLFDDLGERVDYDAPGRGPARLAYSDDNKRLFSCSVVESFLVEYEDSDGMITRRYQGLSEISLVVKQFETTKNRFLAVGDNHSIKIWDVGDEEPLRSIDAGGSLIASSALNPSVRFNKEGTLLAVTAKENRIKILATDNYPQLLRKSEHHSGDASAVLSDSMNKRNSTATSYLMLLEVVVTVAAHWKALSD